MRRGLHEATIDANQIREWWARWPDANIGIRTGARSNLVVLDIDPRHGGEEALAELANRDPTVLDTRLIRTGSGGCHLYFAHPGHTVRNSAGLLAPGIDVRGDNGYVVAPPSIHASGRSYRVGVDQAIAPLPVSIIGATTREPSRIVEMGVMRYESAWARAAFHREVALVATAEPGTRNTTLVRAAFKLGQLVGAARLEHATVSDALVNAATNAGLPLREALATVTRGITAGARQPRGRDADRLHSRWRDP